MLLIKKFILGRFRFGMVKGLVFLRLARGDA